MVLVRGEDNAATELIEEGVNGFVASHASADEMGEALVLVNEAGRDLRESTLSWFAANALRLSLEASLSSVEEAYRDE